MTLSLKSAPFVIAVSLLAQSYSVASAPDPFAELDAEMAVFESQGGGSLQTKTEFERFVAAKEGDYQAWRTQYLQEFDQFQQQVINKWGKAEPIKAHYDVEFSDDKNLKSVIDYQAEEVRVELLIDSKLSQTDAEIAVKQQLEKLLADKQSNIAQLYNEQKITEQGEITVSEVAFSDSNKQQGKDIIFEQVQAQAQEIDKKTDRALLADDSLTEQQAILQAVEDKKQLLTSSQERLQKSDSGYQQAQKNATNETKIVTYRVKLPTNSLQQRASRYVSFAEQESENNQIPASLIMAIMHSESAFNPNAKSAVPAYGLMQIVPTSAGHDVNKLVRNIDEPMLANELYKPAVNVETGSAYLNILDKRYLKAIQNDQSRLYCTIAAYNTGAGNVARVFNTDGSRNINRAAKIINQLSPEQVYQQLLTKLPYDETKQYLQRVNARIALYQTTI